MTNQLITHEWGRQLGYAVLGLPARILSHHPRMCDGMCPWDPYRLTAAALTLKTKPVDARVPWQL